MIDLKIKVKEGKILTDYHERLETLSEVSLLIYELERIKKDLLMKEFPDDFKIEKEDDEYEKQ